MTKRRMLPLYEAKMIHQYDQRWATYERDGSTREVTPAEKADPSFASLPRYWVRQEVVMDRLADRWDRDWLLGFRDICRSTDERTMIADIFRLVAVGHTMPLIFVDAKPEWLVAALSSFAFDYVARQKVGGTHMTFGHLGQLPVPRPGGGPTLGIGISEWVAFRVRFLNGSRSYMDEGLRTLVRAELDACFFHLYELGRQDMDYIMDTFPIVKRKDIAAHGEYRTKRVILEIFDAMLEAESTGVPYASPFDETVLIAEEN